MPLSSHRRDADAHCCVPSPLEGEGQGGGEREAFSSATRSAVTNDSKPERICLGVIAGAHGVRGLVKIKSFTETPEDVAAYGPVTDEAGGKRFVVKVKGRVKGLVLAELEGIRDRDQAQALHGQQLYVERAALPRLDEEETFYQADLIGLAAEDPEGRPLGRVVAVPNFGAGDLLEILDPERVSQFYPFTRDVVPEVDLAAGRVVIRPPAEVIAQPESDQPREDDG